MPVQVAWTNLQWPTNYAHVPQRVLVSFFGFLAIVNAYTMRLCLEIALTQMVFKVSNSSTAAPPEPTPPNASVPRFRRLNMTRLLSSPTSLPPPPPPPADAVERYDWSEHLQLAILASFYVGYVVSQVPGALLADKYGGKWVLGAGILSTALLTLLTPTAVRVGGPVALIVVRLLVGLGEGPTFPALNALLARWVPARERGKLAVLALSGGQVGVSVANFVSGLVLQHFEWSLLFYVFGSCALVWFVLFSFLCYSDPESHPHIAVQEKTYLRQEIRGRAPQTDSALAPTPWKAILSSGPMWALISATVQYDWSQYSEVSEVPRLMADIRKLSWRAGLWASLSASVPFMLRWFVSLGSGFLSDALVTRRLLSTTSVRQIMTSIAAFGPRLFMGFASCLSCEHRGVFSFFNCAMGVMGTYYAGIKLSPLDMSPNYAGTVTGIANAIGSITALFAPYWEKLLADNVSLKELRSLLWLACTALSSGELQAFNDPLAIRSDEYKNR